MGRGGGKGGDGKRGGKQATSPFCRAVAAVSTVGVAWALWGVGERTMHVIRAVPHSPTAAYMKETGMLRSGTPELTETVRAHRFLVIGGAGFTGSALVNDLRQRGAPLVRVLGRTLPPAVEYPYDGEMYPLKGVEYTRGDVTNYESLLRAMDGVSVVLHTAAHYGSPSFGSVGSGSGPEKVNIGGMRNVLRAAREKGVAQVVYTCTSDVTFTGKDQYGLNESHPYATGNAAVGDHYARTKIEAEQLLIAADGEGGVRTISLRPNGIYGPGENSALPRMVFPAYIMRRMPVYFDEDQRTDWVCVYNLVYAHILAVHRLATAADVVAGKAYYITDDELTNNAAYGISAPVMHAIDSDWWPAMRIPSSMLVAMAGGMESLLESTGIDLFRMLGPAALTRKEALKTVTSETHDITRARELLGYRPLMDMATCQRHTGEEFVARLNPVA